MAVIEHLKSLTDPRFLQIYSGLEHQGFGPLDGDVAKAMRFRPQAIKKLPMDQRAKRAKAILLAKSNAEMTYEVFGAYLLRNHRELVTSFLDATGVSHRDGMIDDLQACRPDADKVDAALAELDKRFAREDIALYLALCVEHWPDIAPIVSAWKQRCA